MLRKRDYGVAQRVPFGRLSKQQCVREDRSGHRHGYCGSQIYDRARRREAQVSQLEDENMPNLCPSYKPV